MTAHNTDADTDMTQTQTQTRTGVVSNETILYLSDGTPVGTAATDELRDFKYATVRLFDREERR